MSNNCPTCGPTVTEQHPRLDDVMRCANCKEWLSTNDSTPDPTAGECCSYAPKSGPCPAHDGPNDSTPASEGLTEALAPIEECIDPADLMEAMVHAGAWAVIEATMDTVDREPSRELYEQTVADVRTWLAARVADAEAKARAEEQERIAQAVKAERDGYLDSPTLDPAWIAGWHSATDHHAARLARRGDA